MRTYPDIGLVTGDLLQLARFWLCCELVHVPAYCVPAYCVPAYVCQHIGPALCQHIVCHGQHIVVPAYCVPAYWYMCQHIVCQHIVYQHIVCQHMVPAYCVPAYGRASIWCQHIGTCASILCASILVHVPAYCVPAYWYIPTKHYRYFRLPV